MKTETKPKITPSFNVGDPVYYCGNILKYNVVEVLPDNKYHIKNSITPFNSCIAEQDELSIDNNKPLE